jgi:hypothetical protein
MELLWTATDRMSVDTGVTYNGSSRIEKTARVGLNIGTAGNYISGVSERGTSKWLYVYAKADGTMLFDDDDPDYHDTSGNTAGTKYYLKAGTVYYRCIGAIRLNATGSGEISVFRQAGNYIEWEEVVSVSTTVSNGAWLAAYSCSAGIPSISTLGNFVCHCELNGGASAIWLRANGSSKTPDTVLYSDAVVYGATNFYGVGTVECKTDSSQQIQHYNNAALTTTSVSVLGYYLEDVNVYFFVINCTIIK